jgi:choline-sulfatase
VTPTLCDLAGISMAEVQPWTAGESLVVLAAGGDRSSPVMMEYAAEASVSPLVALRQGQWKYTRCAADPEQLFNLAADPHELNDLAADPSAAETLARFRAMADERWDLAAYDAQIRESQARRWVVYEALRNGNYYPWDYQPLQKASERYMRNHMDLNVVEENARFPRGE